MRPTIRPGLQLLRRDLHTIQLGLDWPGIGCLVDTPALRAVLASVDGFRDLAGVVLAAAEQRDVSRGAAQESIDLLLDCGVLVDASAVRRPDLEPATLASLWLLAGPEQGAHDILAARRSCRIHVVGTGRIADAVRSLLPHADVAVATDTAHADLLVVASDHEPDRSHADEALRSGLPHVWATVRDVVGVIGPFVVPGSSACLRCVDQARAELDPAWPTLLEALAAKRREPTACDPVLAHLVGAWAAQEAVLFASRLRPQTWGCVIEIPHGLGAVQTQRFELHPSCGCGWPVWRDTMGA
ncbi:MAG: hypothetical protein ACRDPG_12785 [Nocardioidaceae bacterium]